nr:hypothetical protein TetV2_00544 [Oceanusvirus sp.]
MDFVDPDEAAQQMYSSGFIDALGRKNLRARAAETREEYKELYKSGLADWYAVPVELRQRLVGITGVAKRRLKEAGYHSLADMEWRYACSVGRKTENGWPHTTGDVIVMPLTALDRRGDEDLIRLVVHEAVHVAQRKDPVGTEGLVRGLGFARATASAERKIASLGESRANPDTDGVLYERDETICHPVFHGNVSNLSDIRYLPDQVHDGLEWVDNPEHPYEIMAELVADAVT